MAYSRGSQAKFDAIYDEYQGLVRNVLYNMVGGEVLDDLTQEAFIRIWNGLPRFAFRSSLKTWIYRVSVNTAIDYLRHKKLNKAELQEEQQMQKKISNISTEVELVESSLGILDEDCKAIVILFYFEEMGLKDISKTLEIPEGTVKSRLFYAKKKMKLFLEQQGVPV